MDVICNLPYLEYYLVDQSLNWMILETHHGVLIGIGEPAESFVKGLDSA